jgi:polyribonucleotide nucleotidyltransferase
MILDLTAEAEVGQTYTGKVVRIEEYGAFVEIMPNLVGLMHVSEIAPYHVRSVSDVLRLGDVVTVKVLSIEDNKIRLSMKALNPNAVPPEGSEGQGQGDSGNAPRPYQPRNDRDRGRGGRGRY